ncbi:hypothetical protein LCGC14_0370350 [marine sediment metagenome]|uniref:Uncharacterized protein n=1 Tax=marine sediment metagenome TaxID=412755 RepID=A0A0F9VST2_9ZZZZ
MANTPITGIAFSSGYMTLTYQNGTQTRQPVSDILRALDIPDLNIDSLTLLTNLAQVVMVLLQTLMEQGIVTDEFAGKFSLEYLWDRLINDMNAQPVS